MKHIFLLHSNTTLISTIGVIENEKLEKDDIILFLTRGYNTTLNYRSYNLNNHFQRLENINLYNFYKGWKIIDEIDSFLEESINEDYTLYLPHFVHPFFQILITSKYCVRINIIEEGSNCLSVFFYRKSNSIKFKLVDIFFNSTKIFGNGRYDRIYTSYDFLFKNNKYEPIFYSFSPNAFSKIAKYTKKTINCNFPELYNDDKIIQNNSSILVLEAIFEQGNLSENLFFNSIEAVIALIKDETIYVKFHPAQNKENISKIINLIINNKKIIVIPNFIILEFEFMRCKDLSVFGFTSSLLLYARLYGHNVSSYSSLWDKDFRYKKYRKLNDFPLLDAEII